MAELKQLEFFLLRYVPDAVKEEFVNIGLLVREVGRGGFSAVKITEDWSRVRCIDPEADLEVLTGLGLQLQSELQETRDWELLLRKLEDLFSNQVQVSAVKACLAEDPAQETAALAKLYLHKRRAVGRLRVTGRQFILHGMEKAFEEAGILEFLQREIQIAKYTNKKGDPQSFDFAYPHGDQVKFLQAVSLKSDVKTGLLLAARFPGIVRDIYEAQKMRAGLTVVVDDDLDHSQDEIGFAIGMMRESQIRVADVGEMAGIAAEVRRELGA